MRFVNWLLVGMLCASCAPQGRIQGTIPAARQLSVTKGFVAGAARIDITPHPGFPMGGYGPSGKTARGYWTRLYARAIYVRHEDRALALVSCDLWSISSGLSDRVSEIVARAPAATGLGREQILLAATHTHHSPGAFASAKAHNGFAARWLGYDPDLFEFLAQRIAQAILDAHRKAAPATLHRNHVPAMEKLVRNRAFDAFVLNPERDAILAANAALPAGHLPPDFPREETYRAADPRLRVLRFERNDKPGSVIAMAAFVALHPTAMGNATEVYSSDLFGVAVRGLERKHRTVVAIFNGAEGDLISGWRKQDRSNTLALGGNLARHLGDMMTGGTRVDTPAIDYRYRKIRVAGRTFRLPDGASVQTAGQAIPGTAFMGGGEDGKTLFYTLGWVPGVRGPRKSPRYENWQHGAKQPAMDLRLDPNSLGLVERLVVTNIADTSKLFPPDTVPRELPVAIYRIGDTALAALPGEFTMVMGRRIDRALGKILGMAPERVVCVGLANAYLSYITTAEEYDAQLYEGSSTLYGQNSGRLFLHELSAMARELGRRLPPPRDWPYDYKPGTVRRFQTSDVGVPPVFEDDGLANVVQDAGNGYPLRELPRFVWSDVVPRVGTTKRVTPRVRIIDMQGKVVSDPDGSPESDDGLNFVALVLATGPQETRWCSIWMPPEWAKPWIGTGRKLRFQVETIGKGTIESKKPFQVTAEHYAR